MISPRLCFSALPTLWTALSCYPGGYQAKGGEAIHKPLPSACQRQLHPPLPGENSPPLYPGGTPPPPPSHVPSAAGAWGRHLIPGTWYAKGRYYSLQAPNPFRHLPSRPLWKDWVKPNFKFKFISPYRCNIFFQLLLNVFFFLDNCGLFLPPPEKLLLLKKLSRSGRKDPLIAKVCLVLTTERVGRGGVRIRLSRVNTVPSLSPNP